MSDSGYVYLVTHSNALGLHRIGRTRHPANRTLQLGEDNCTIVAMVMCVDAAQTEGLLQKRFASNRIPQSGWFNLNNDELQEACEVLVNAHKEAAQYFVLPTVPPKPEPEPKQDPPPKIGPDGFLGWTEAEAKRLAGGRRFGYVPGRGYCLEKTQ